MLKKIGFQKLYIGFLIIILLSLFNLVFNYFTATNNISSLEVMNRGINPYVTALDEFKQEVRSSKLYSTAWVFLPKNINDRQRLQYLHEAGFPDLKKRINLFLKINPVYDQKDSISKLLQDFETILRYEKEIMTGLADFSAYEEGSIEPALALEVLESEVIPRSDKLLKKLGEIVAVRKNEAGALSHDIDDALHSMLVFIPLLSVIVFVIIVLAIIYIHSSITTPVLQVQKYLREMSRGKSVDISIKNLDGVIGNMVAAVEVLGNSLKNTSSFAVAIGKGEFDAHYNVRSEDDDLGKALVEMRNSLNEYANEMNAKVEARTKELQDALDHLKSTQAQLVQSEKMASLGQLIAGVAHEVNTPLGAIRASIGAINETLPKTLEMVPQVYTALSDEDLLIFKSILTRAFENKNSVPLTSREERKIRKELKNYFSEKGFGNASELGTLFVDIGIHDDLDGYLPLLNHKDTPLILKTIYYLVSQKKNGENIDLAVKKASKVVFALKSFSRNNTEGDKAPANLVENIETVLTLYHNQLKQGIEVHKDLDRVQDIMCFGDELGQVWTNLITNAVQAMNNQGVIDVSLKDVGENLVVKVQDHGPGIPADTLEKIFVPFFTTKKAGEGSGLGLDIVKKIVDKHDGTIDVESEVGVGTTFTVTIPKVSPGEK